MNNPHEIENLLRQMPLVKPSADLGARVADALAAGAADSGAAGSSAAGTETRRANSPEVRRANSPEVRRANSPEVRRANSPEVRRANTPETRRANSWGRPHPMRAWLFGAVGGALAAAAAVILAVGLPHDANTVTPAAKSLPAPVEVARSLPQPDPAAAPVEPVRFEQNWSELSYEGLVCPDPETPMQTFRRRTVDRVQFFDPQRNIRMETTVPREEIIFVKASMQ